MKRCCEGHDCHGHDHDVFDHDGGDGCAVLMIVFQYDDDVESWHAQLLLLVQPTSVSGKYVLARGKSKNILMVALKCRKY
jgi:hypothetical protein